MLATSINGVFVFNVKDGSTTAAMKIPGNRKLQVALSYGDRQFFIIFIDQKVTTIRVYNLADVIASGNDIENTPKVVKEFCATNGNEFVNACWGPLNKSLYVASKSGKIQIIDVGSGKTIKDS